MQDVILILLIPFAGSVFGALFVFVIQGEVSLRAEAILSGFSAGVMVAASVFSLLIPAMESSADYGLFAALPALIGLFSGFLLMLLVDLLSDKLFQKGNCAAGEKRVFLLTLAVTVHNLPEGMAVGVALAGVLAGNTGMTLAAVLALAVGVALQNIPEGSIISLPLAASGVKKTKAFALGVYSGAVEPIGAAFTLFAARLVLPILPYLLGFAAGAMLSVVVTELVPASRKAHIAGTLAFAVGFSVMTFLDVALG